MTDPIPVTLQLVPLRRSLVVALLGGLVVTCTPETDYRDVRIDPILPAGDEDARQALASIRVEVWPPSRGLCAEIATWLASSCGGGCDAPPGIDESPLLTTTLVRTAEGGWSAPSLSPDGPAEVVLRGFDATSTPFLHGCAAVDFAADSVVPVPLRRAWCDANVCGPCEELLCAQLPAAGDDWVDPSCESRCGAEQDCCDGQCVYLRRDPLHCGGCDTACSGNAFCGNGLCDPGCTFVCLTLSECGPDCYKGDWCDEANACRCGDEPLCEGEQRCCDSQCVATSTDPANCGACGNACEAGQECVNGVCG